MILIDSHVHLYENINAELFFTTVMNNFNVNISSTIIPDNVYRVIFLTESKGLNKFKYFADSCPFSDDLRVFITKEDNSLIIETSNHEKIIMIRGKQLETKENIEVLSVGTAETRDYLTLENTIISVLSAGGLPIIPWGFGKWWSKRGEILTNFLRKTDLSCFFLGDNGGRPSFLSSPLQFKVAADKGIKILPGSDPLPIPNDFKRIATYGFKLDNDLDLEKPAAHLIHLLFSMKNNPEYFGNLCKTGDFIKRQTLLRLTKHQNFN